MDIDIDNNIKDFSKEIIFLEKIESNNLKNYKKEIILNNLDKLGILNELMNDLKSDIFSHFILDKKVESTVFFIIPNKDFLKSCYNKKKIDPDFDNKLSNVNELLKNLGYLTSYIEGDEKIYIYNVK